MEERKIDYSRLGQERVINIRELIFECIRKWWIIAICAVLFAVLLGGYKYQKDIKNAQVSMNGNSKEEKLDIEEITAEMSDDEVLDANNIIYMKKSIIQMKEYLDNSILMRLNLYNKSIVTLQYYVDNGYRMDYSGITEKDNSVDLSVAYQTYIAGGGLVRDIKDTIFQDVDIQYISELIKIKPANGNSIIIEIAGEDEATCLELSEEVQRLLDNYQITVNEQIGNHQLKLISAGYSVVLDSDTINVRATKENTIQEYQNKIETSMEGMSPLQKSYIDVQFTEDEKDILEEETVKEVKKPDVRISKKYVVVGAFGGMLLAVLVIVFLYLMKGTINSAEDIQYLYNLRILGKIGKGKWFSRDNYSLEEQLQFVLVNLKMSMDLQQVKKAYVCGSCLDKLNQEEITRIRQGAEKLNLSLEFGESYVYDPISLEKMLSCESVVLLEKEQCSKYTDLVNEYKVCMEYQKPILGVVVFR